MQHGGSPIQVETAFSGAVRLAVDLGLSPYKKGQEHTGEVPLAPDLCEGKEQAATSDQYGSRRGTPSRATGCEA